MMLLALPACLVAQKMRGGIKGGLNVSNLYVDNVDDENLRLSGHIGIYTQLGQGFFVIQPEISYSGKGASVKYGNDLQGEADFRFNYIDFPILGTFKIGNDFDFHIGPYFGYLLVAKVDTENIIGSTTTEFDREQYNAIDIGAAFGMAINFEFVSVGVRYNYGLRKIAKSDATKLLLGDAKNSTGQVFVALNL